MRKIIFSLAALTMLAGFAAGCARTEKPAPAPVVRKG
jgi:hypothetical protein